MLFLMEVDIGPAADILLHGFISLVFLCGTI